MLKILWSMQEFHWLQRCRNNLACTQSGRVFKMLKLETIRKKKKIHVTGDDAPSDPLPGRKDSHDWGWCSFRPSPWKNKIHMTGDDAPSAPLPGRIRFTRLGMMPLLPVSLAQSPARQVARGVPAVPSTAPRRCSRCPWMTNMRASCLAVAASRWKSGSPAPVQLLLPWQTPSESGVRLHGRGVAGRRDWRGAANSRLAAHSAARSSLEGAASRDACRRHGGLPLHWMRLQCLTATRRWRGSTRRETNHCRPETSRAATCNVWDTLVHNNDVTVVWGALVNNNITLVWDTVMVTLH